MVVKWVWTAHAKRARSESVAEYTSHLLFFVIEYVHIVVVVMMMMILHHFVLVHGSHYYYCYNYCNDSYSIRFHHRVWNMVKRVKRAPFHVGIVTRITRWNVGNAFCDLVVDYVSCDHHPHLHLHHCHRNQHHCLDCCNIFCPLLYLRHYFICFTDFDCYSKYWRYLVHHSTHHWWHCLQ